MAHMCRALHDFSAKHADSLTVHQGERFLVLNDANADNPHWWFVVNGLGQMGYVPRSYVDIEKVSDESLIQEIDDLLELLHGDPAPTFRNRNLIKSLVKVRSSLKKESLPHDSIKKKGPAPLPPTRENGTSLDCELNGKNTSKQSPTDSTKSPIITQTQSPEVDQCLNQLSTFMPPVAFQDEETDNSNSSCNNTKSGSALQAREVDLCDKSNDLNCTNLSTSEVTCVDSSTQTLDLEFSFPPVLIPEIVDHVRSQTHLSYSMSILAVTTAMETLGVHLPHLSVLFNNVTKELNQLKVARNSSQVFESRDRERLLLIFHTLWSCKEDSEQRSWPLQEDETIILEQLHALKQLLVDADSRVCREVIQLENYECIHTLVTYYQMEVRRTLRLAVLSVLGLTCCLDIEVIEQLLSSVLPSELVLDMQNHTTDRDRFIASAQLLSCVFSTGVSPPRTVYTHLNVSFVSWVLNQLESLLEDMIDEEVANMNLCILLSLNLHLLRPEENFVLEAVRIRTNTPVALTEKLMLLINREEDPVCLLSSGEMQAPNSVLKLLLDLFSDTVCAQHFYVNDIKVLLDIIVRQLTDLPASTKRRLDYLNLTRHILTNTCYMEHKHQQAGLTLCLEWLLEHEDFSQDEKDFSRNLISDFPHLFQFA